jgi:hypothetical protein
MSLEKFFKHLTPEAKIDFLYLIDVTTAVQFVRINRLFWRFYRDDQRFWRRVYVWRFLSATDVLEREYNLLSAIMVTDVQYHYGEDAVLEKQINTAPQAWDLLQTFNHVVTNTSSLAQISGRQSGLGVPSDKEMMQHTVKTLQYSENPANNTLVHINNSALRGGPNVHHRQNIIHPLSACLKRLSLVEKNNSARSGELLALEASVSETMQFIDEAKMASFRKHLSSSKTSSHHLSYGSTLIEKSLDTSVAMSGKSSAENKQSYIANMVAHPHPLMKRHQSKTVNQVHSHTIQHDAALRVRKHINWRLTGQLRAQTETNIRQNRYCRRWVEPPAQARGPIFVRAAFGRWVVIDIGREVYLLEICREGNLSSKKFSTKLTTDKPSQRQQQTDNWDGSREEITYDVSHIMPGLAQSRMNYNNLETLSRWLRNLGDASEEDEDYDGSTPPIHQTNVACNGSAQSQHMPMISEDMTAKMSFSRTQCTCESSKAISTTPKVTSFGAKGPCVPNGLMYRQKADEKDVISSANSGSQVQFLWRRLKVREDELDPYGWVGNGVIRVMLNHRYIVRILCTPSIAVESEASDFSSFSSFDDAKMRNLCIWQLCSLTSQTDPISTKQFDPESIEPHHIIKVPVDTIPHQILGRWLLISFSSTLSKQAHQRLLKVIDLQQHTVCIGSVECASIDGFHLHTEDNACVYVYTYGYVNTHNPEACTNKPNATSNANGSSSSNCQFVWHLWRFRPSDNILDIVDRTIQQPELALHGTLHPKEVLNGYSAKGYKLHSMTIDNDRVLLWNEYGWVAVHHIQYNRFIWEYRCDVITDVILFPTTQTVFITFARQQYAMQLRLDDGDSIGGTNTKHRPSRNGQQTDSNSSQLPVAKSTAKHNKAASFLRDTYGIVLDYSMNYQFMQDILTKTPDTRTKLKKKGNRDSTGSIGGLSQKDKGRYYRLRHWASSSSVDKIEQSKNSLSGYSTRTKTNATIYWPENSFIIPILDNIICRSDNSKDKSQTWLLDLRKDITRIGLIQSDPIPKNIPSAWQSSVTRRVMVLAAGGCLIDVHRRNAQIILWDFVEP